MCNDKKGEAPGHGEHERGLLCQSRGKESSRDSATKVPLLAFAVFCWMRHSRIIRIAVAGGEPALRARELRLNHWIYDHGRAYGAEHGNNPHLAQHRNEVLNKLIVLCAHFDFQSIDQLNLGVR